MDLNTVSFALLGVMVSGYAILDGFDLGVGALSLLARTKEERDIHIASICPVWDGNQVWLLTTGNVLFGAFPVVFTMVFSGLYLGFMLLLTALIARAVAIEFRLMYSSYRWIRFWDWAYGLGSLATALILGVAVGNVLRGMPIGPDFSWQGSPLGLFNPYALLVGLVSSALFIMHGAVYLWMKTEGELSDRHGRTALRAYFVFLLIYGAAAIATHHVSPSLFAKTGSSAFLGLSALLAAALAILPLAIRAGKKRRAFLASSGTIALMVMLTALSSHPTLVPSVLDPAMSLTIYNAASTPGTLTAMIAVAGIGLPIMLVYTCAVYRVFRGPARAE